MARCLRKTKTIPLKQTLEKLELSYNGLENDHKEIFLEVACILKGQPKDIAVRILESYGFHVEIGLRVLEQKSLIDLSDVDFLSLHDHLEEMGKNIDRQLHTNQPNRRKQLWINEETEYILVNDLGTEATRSIILQNTSLHPSLIMKGRRKLKELRFLHVFSEETNWEIDEDSIYLPDSLKYLSWHSYPFWYLPKAFHANKLDNHENVASETFELWDMGERKVLNELIFLDLSFSNLATFNLGMTPNLKTLFLFMCAEFEELHMAFKYAKLEILDLSYSKIKALNIGLTPCLERLDLHECHDFVELMIPNECPKLKVINLNSSKVSNLNIWLTPCLEELHIRNCLYFVDLCMPIECPKLKYLDLSGSKVRYFNIGLTPCLEELYLDRCNNFVGLQMPIECPKLKSLDLSGSKVSNLNVGLTPCLEMLNLGRCGYFADLHMPMECLNLKFLNLNGSKVSNFNIGLTPCLEELNLRGCNEILGLQMLTEYPKLKFLNLSGSKVGNINLELTPCLEELYLEGCNAFVELHMPVECPKLKILSLSGSKVTNLNLRLTPCLEELYLVGCYEFVELHMPVEFSKLEILKIIGSKASKLRHGPNPCLEMLDLSDCYYLLEFHAPTGCLKKLAFRNLELFTASICGLQHLIELTLEGGIPEVPKDLYILESLMHLTLSMKEIKRLPDSICMLKNLKYLKLGYCQLLEQLPNDLGRLQGLEELHLTDCISLRDIPNSICNMKSLKYLDLQFCILVEKLPKEFGRLESLEEINIEGAGIRHLPQSIFRLNGLYIVGSTWRLESFGFTSLKEISTCTASCYVRDSQHEFPL